MSIEVTCDGCRKRYKVPGSAAGKKLRCKSCGAAIVVPADSDPFENPDALLAIEPASAPVEAAPYFPPPQPSGGSSKATLLIAAGTGGVLVIVAVVMAVLHFGKSTPEGGGDAPAQKKSARVSLPETGSRGTTIEARLGEIWTLYTQYAAAHDGRLPATLEEAGHPELRSGIDSGRGINFDLGVRNLKLCKAPLPAKMIVVTGLGSRDASGNLTEVVLFGDGQIQTFDKQGYEKAKQESAVVEDDAMLWLASDPSTPAGAVAAWFVAQGMGDAQSLKARTCKVDDNLLDANAAQRSASREFVTAAAARFPSLNSAEPRPPKTAKDITRQVINLIRGGSEDIDGDTAKFGSDRSLELKKINGEWRLDARPLFDNPSTVQTQLAILILQINARATREVTQEIVQGKYADWPAARQAVLDRMKTLATTDDSFQQTVKAHRGMTLPSFAMVAPWTIQQDAPAQIAPAPTTPAQVAQLDPAPAARAQTPTPPAVQKNATTTTPTPDTTPILPDPNDKPEPIRTEMAGGKGGGPFEKASPDGTPIVGFSYALGRWKTQGVVQQFEPIFQSAPERPAAAENMKTLVARNGYVVGGLLVDYDDTNVVALRVIFVRRKDNQIDAADQYRSEWIGTPAGKHQQQIAGKGEAIIGTFGRQGLNLGAIGLLKPSNLRKTAMVGGNGGGPFSSAGDGEKLVRGFRYSPGNWNGPVIGHFYPLYDPAGNDPPATAQDLKSASHILARDGYAVGGLIADFDDVNFFAFRVIFLREKDGILDPKDQYTSDWVGTPRGKHQQQLAGKGEKIVGIFGRQGMNFDAIGLLELLPQSAAPKADSPK